MTKEYIVSLKADVDYNAFWNEIENDGNTNLFIPDRRVDIVNERPGSLRSCHYALTDLEAAYLKNDPRVYSVEIPPDQRTDIKIGRLATQSGDFTKTTSDSGSYINWGIRRCIDITNPYGALNTVSGNYDYNNDGTGVDVVIQDSGIQSDHPEFTDANGVSRVREINWYILSGLPGTQSPSHYRDYDGHGTHCAGIAAGKTYGWARNSRIYSVKVNGLEGDGDEGTGMSVSDCFDVIKLWHLNKPINPATGARRPTIVNMSWGYSTFYSTVSSVTYRGANYTDSSTTSNSGYRYSQYGIVPNSGGFFSTYSMPVRVGSVDADIEELIAAGVHVCIAAGNAQYYMDVPGGIDYNNNTQTDGGTKYFHRGSSPCSVNANMVGSLDSTVAVSAIDQKSTFSNGGPGVNIWAPGSNIMSATSTTNRWGAGSQNYYLNASYKQTNISGTSMASPQVCGIGALYLQRYPATTPTELQGWLATQGTQGARIFSTGSSVDYTNQRSILGSAQNLVYWPYARTAEPVTSNQTGSFTMSNGLFISYT